MILPALLSHYEYKDAQTTLSSTAPVEESGKTSMITDIKFNAYLYFSLGDNDNPISFIKLIESGSPDLYCIRKK